MFDIIFIYNVICIVIFCIIHTYARLSLFRWCKISYWISFTDKLLIVNAYNVLVKLFLIYFINFSRLIRLKASVYAWYKINL